MTYIPRTDKEYIAKTQLKKQMKFSDYQYNNIVSLITYLEDCIKYHNTNDKDLVKLINTKNALTELIGDKQ